MSDAIKPVAWIGRGVITGAPFATLSEDECSPACGPFTPLYDQSAIDAARAEERERCAKVARSWATEETATTCENIASAILACG